MAAVYRFRRGEGRCQWWSSQGEALSVHPVQSARASLWLQSGHVAGVL